MMKKFDIPETPWELIAAQRNVIRKLYNRDYSLRTPVLSLDYPAPSFEIEGQTYCGFHMFWKAKRRVEDAEFDVRCQLEAVRHQIDCLNCSAEVGLPLWNAPAFNLLHYGTAPLATAFGSKMILRDEDNTAFEPAVHTPAEAMKLKKPNLFKDGILPQILERIQYYNEATRGKVMLNNCDTGSAWSIATSIWHYEDMLEAIYTAPEAVHYLLDMVTECIVEWNNIQEACIGRWSRTHHGQGGFFPRGHLMGDDCLVSVSPATWEEFFMPYNNRLAREYGGIFYHCCGRYDTHFQSIIKTDGFMGFDANLCCNDFDKIEAALVQAHGIWSNPFISSCDMEFINRLRGKVGMMFRVTGRDRADAVRLAKEFLADLADPERTRWGSPLVRRWNVSKLLPPKDIAAVPSVRLADPLDWETWPAQSSPNWGSINFVNIHDKYQGDGLVYAANRFLVEKAGRWIIQLGNDGPARVFVNGIPALTAIETVNPAAPKRCQAEVALTAGEHEIVVAFDTDNGRGWGFFFSFEVPEADRTAGRPPSFPTPVL